MQVAQNTVDSWPCGHERTPENTQSLGNAGKRCRKCRRSIAQRSYEYNYLDHRMRYLPGAINATRRKLAALEREAAEYGMVELL